MVNWKTIGVINALDETIYIGVKSSNKQKILRKEIHEIKERIEEAQENAYFDLLKTIASVSSRMTQKQAQSYERE